ncbi:hypothetical protein AHiyo8_19560 [Arthrobacter sp. Hiyo8]|nr:hypothetical protein AHiyo8_19560 [Arthrobacter sp. Hiyo8]
MFNLTVTAPQSFGFISAYASGTPRPNASNVNFAAGQTVPNLVTVPVGPTAKSPCSTAPPEPPNSSPTSPATTSQAPPAPRSILAPRSGADAGHAHHRRGSPDSSVSFQVGGAAGIPTDVSAVVFNLTVTAPQSFGFISAYASGTPRPNASNVNFAAGQTVPNLVTVPVGPDGKVTLFNRSSGTTQLIADVSGYYLPGTASAPGAFSPSLRRGCWTRAPPPRFPGLFSLLPSRRSGRDSYRCFCRSVQPDRHRPTILRIHQRLRLRHTTPERLERELRRRPDRPEPRHRPGRPDGKVTLFNRSSGTTQLIADVSGYYLPGSPAGSVWTWGGPTYTTAPAGMAGLSGVTALTGGHSKYALLSNGTVQSWGVNLFGQLGNGTTTDSGTLSKSQA